MGPKATGETMHIIIETEGKIPFWEGQSYGVIPPGEFWFFFTFSVSRSRLVLFLRSLRSSASSPRFLPHLLGSRSRGERNP